MLLFLKFFLSAANHWTFQQIHKVAVILRAGVNTYSNQPGLQTDVNADSVASRPCMESSQISTWLLFNDTRRLTGSLLQIASQITQWLPAFFIGTK